MLISFYLKKFRKFEKYFEHLKPYNGVNVILQLLLFRNMYKTKIKWSKKYACFVKIKKICINKTEKLFYCLSGKSINELHVRA